MLKKITLTIATLAILNMPFVSYATTGTGCIDACKRAGLQCPSLCKLHCRASDDKQQCVTQCTGVCDVTSTKCQDECLTMNDSRCIDGCGKIQKECVSQCTGNQKCIMNCTNNYNECSDKCITLFGASN